MALDNRLNEHAQRLDRTLRIAWRARPGMLTTAKAAGLNERHLDTGDVDALEHIALAGEQSMSQLARSLRIDPSTATRTVDRLVHKNLACRRRDPDDARRQIVALTPAGSAAQGESARRRTALALRLVKRFELEEQDEIGRLWPSLGAAIDQVLNGTAPTHPRVCVPAHHQPADDEARQLANAEALGRAWQIMRRARGGIVARTTAGLADLGLEPGDVDALDQIVAVGPDCQMSTLASGLSVTASSATKAVDRLVRKGLAARLQDPTDRRVVRVLLSDAGTRAQAHVRTEREAFSAQVLAMFDIDDRESIGRLLPGIADAVIEEFGALRPSS